MFASLSGLLIGSVYAEVQGFDSLTLQLVTFTNRSFQCQFREFVLTQVSSSEGTTSCRHKGGIALLLFDPRAK